MDTLLGVEPVSSPHNITALRHLFDQVETHVRGLKALGITSDTYGNLLLPLLTKKLPGELRLAISRVVPEDEWKLDKVMSTLDTELRARERAVPQTTREPAHSQNPSTMGSFLTGDTGPPSCCYSRTSIIRTPVIRTLDYGYG